VTAPGDPIHTPATSRNPTTLAGVALTTASALAFIVYYVVETLGYIINPYAGLFGFILVPALFVLGLVLIPFGMWRERRRRQRGRTPWPWPVVDLRQASTRRVVFAVAVLTLVNLGIVSIAGLGALHYMETKPFCGQVCHTPMRPQFVALQWGAHANVGCVACHVGPGATGLIKAKLNGTRQMYEVAVGSYPRPIHAEGRVPAAADTCVTCHRPGFTPRDTTKVIREYADDEANTETVTTLDMLTSAIHWHARPDVRVEFAVSDADPNVVTYIRSAVGGGTAREFFGPTVTAAPVQPPRRMDCRDCHSRPAHAFAATAERTVDNAIGAGEIDRTLPFVRRETVAALKVEYATEADAHAAIRRRLTEFYTARDPKLAPQATKAADTAVRLYTANVFPDMKVTWGTHISQLGHVDVPGCFRCHDDEHKTRDAATVVKQDCEICHKVR
jgi:hypothetical protein